MVKEFGDDVVDIYAGADIIFHLSKKGAKLDKERVAKVLKPFKVKMKSFGRDNDFIL